MSMSLIMTGWRAKYRDVGQTEMIELEGPGSPFSNSLLGVMQDSGERFVRDPQGRALSLQENGRWRYFLHDAHPGSIVGVTDFAGTMLARYRWDPFGAEKAITGPGADPPDTDLGFAEGSSTSASTSSASAGATRSSGAGPSRIRLTRRSIRRRPTDMPSR